MSMKREKTIFRSYVKQLSSYKHLDLDEEMRIYYNIFIGVKDQLLINRLIESHIPLAVKIARRYTGKGIEFEELLSIVVHETTQLAHKYNPGTTHRHRFGTILPSRLQKAIRLAFIEAKKFKGDEGVFDSTKYVPDMELRCTVDKVLKDNFSEVEIEALKYRWEGGCTLTDTMRLVGKSQSSILKMERRAKKLLKEVLKLE